MRAVAIGAAVVIAVGVPVATAGAVLLDEGSDLVFAFAAVVVAAFVAGGWVAAKEAPRAPVAAGAAAALAGFAVAQAVSAGLQVASDEEVRIVAVAANAGLAAAAGVVGGLGASRRSEAASR